MARDKFRVKGPDDEFISAADDIEELIKRLEEKEGLADAEELVEDYNGF